MIGGGSKRGERGMGERYEAKEVDTGYGNGIGRRYRWILEGREERRGTEGVMIDDRCILAAYMAGVWVAYLEFWQDIRRTSKSTSLQIEANTIHITSQDTIVSLFDNHLLLMYTANTASSTFHRPVITHQPPSLHPSVQRK